MGTVHDITTRHALNRLYAKAQRIGRMEAQLDALREIHMRIGNRDTDLMSFADWLSQQVGDGLDESARENQ